MTLQRRKFIRQSAGAVLGLSVLPTSVTSAFTYVPSDTLNIGVIGCNGMGWADTNSLLKMSDVNCLGICDVDQNVIDRRMKDYSVLRNNKPKTYQDYRELLDDKDIDAVVIGTPDHWHCRILVDALNAGKHVYCEKPLANSIEECYLMEQAVEKAGKVTQVGQWQRSASQYEQAYEIVKSGDLGNIRLVKVWAYQGWMKPVTPKPDQAPPEGVDYKMWLGPAPDRPFNPNRFHFNFRWFWDYAGGLMTDWGVHEIDIALHHMGVTAPRSVFASGGKFAYPNDASETPDTLQAVFEYDGFNMLWEHGTGIDNGNYGRTEGIAFIGNNATLVVNRGGLELIPETEREEGKVKYKMPDMPDQPAERDPLDDHTRNFVEAIRKNDPTTAKCPVKSGSTAAINAHMGNIAYRTGHKLYWDPAQKTFKDDTKANAFIKPTYHHGWKLP